MNPPKYLLDFAGQAFAAQEERQRGHPGCVPSALAASVLVVKAPRRKLDLAGGIRAALAHAAPPQWEEGKKILKNKKYNNVNTKKQGTRSPRCPDLVVSSETTSPSPRGRPGTFPGRVWKELSRPITSKPLEKIPGASHPAKVRSPSPEGEQKRANLCLLRSGAAPSPGPSCFRAKSLL